MAEALVGWMCLGYLFDQERAVPMLSVLVVGSVVEVVVKKRQGDEIFMYCRAADAAALLNSACLTKIARALACEETADCPTE